MADLNKRKVGSVYESLAAEHLIGKGYRILERNYRCRLGEVDLIAEKEIGGIFWLVFVEVKYRASLTYGYPAEAVTASKQRTIHKVAGYYLMQHRYTTQTPCRFDVISILGSEITHLEGVF